MRRARGAFGQAGGAIVIPYAFHGSVPRMKLSATVGNAQSEPRRFHSASYALFVLWLFGHLPISWNALILQGTIQIECP